MADDERPYDQTYREFTAIEAEIDLFDVTVDDVSVWERLRWRVFRSVLEQRGILNQSQTRKDGDSKFRQRLAMLGALGRNLVVRNPFVVGHHDVMVIGHQRRKQQPDGTWIDIYCDPIYDSADLDYVHFEPLYGNTHFTPAVTDRLRYLDLIEVCGKLLENTVASVTLDEDEAETLNEASRTLSTRLDCEIDLRSRVEDVLSRRRATLGLYDRLIERVDPAVAVVLSALGRKTLIEALKRRSVPVVELQHGTGLQTKYELGHSLPSGRNYKTYPDYIFVWGEFWKNVSNLPIDGDRVYVTGYPYMEQQYEQYADAETADQVLFISQGQYTHVLPEYAIELARRQSAYDIVYKVHPGDYGKWRASSPELADSPVRVVEEEVPLYQLFAESSKQVGVSSTALFEGLRFGLDTYLVDLPGIEYMFSLFELCDVPLVADVDELLTELGTPTNGVNPERFFEPNAVENFEAALADVRHRKRGGESESTHRQSGADAASAGRSQ
jgi:hypothetical protein